MNIRELVVGTEITDGSKIYTLEERLGEGRQGVCYRADFHGDEKVVKLMQSSDDLVARLRTRLFDLNLALGTRYNVFKIDPVTFAVVGDYYPGKNIRETLNENERLYSEDEVREFLLQMGRRWLGPLYSRRLIHHDIKPENIIVNDGVYSLIDFGGVRSLDSQSLSLSLTGEDIRSFGYSRFYGERSLQDDLYSLGKVAMFMLSGKDSSVLLVTDEEKDRRENGEAIETLKASAKMKSVIGRLLGVERVYGVPEEMVMDLEERSLIVSETRLVVPERGLVPLKFHSLSEDYFLRSKQLQRFFLENYAGYAPNFRPLSDEFRKEFEELLKLNQFVEGSWKSGMKENFVGLGKNFGRKFIEKTGVETVYYFEIGNFYFGLTKMNNSYRGPFHIYISLRTEMTRGKGRINRICGLYSSYCWDERILEHVLKPVVRK
jgi:serine/threonine protein kinase